MFSGNYENGQVMVYLANLASEPQTLKSGTTLGQFISSPDIVKGELGHVKDTCDVKLHKLECQVDAQGGWPEQALMHTLQLDSADLPTPLLKAVKDLLNRYSG